LVLLPHLCSLSLLMLLPLALLSVVLLLLEVLPLLLLAVIRGPFPVLEECQQ
jgi:hypothetical protein